MLRIRSTSVAIGVTKVPPSLEKTASSASGFISEVLLAEQSELDQILHVEHADGTSAVDDDDAVHLSLLEQLHRVVQQALAVERVRRLREADRAQRLVENGAAVRLQLAPQVAVREDARDGALRVDDRDETQPRLRHL